MNIHNWDSHLNSRSDAAIEGLWGNTAWEFYGYDAPLPDTLPISTSMCVPVSRLDPHNPQVVLTLKLDRGGYEIPGGHVDILTNGKPEAPAETAVRETEEETGLRIEKDLLIPYGYIEAKNRPGGKYPPLSYMQFFGVHAPESPGRITDPKVDGAGIFSIDALHIMARRGAIRTAELGLICLGVRAVLKNHGISDEYIKMP